MQPWPTDRSHGVRPVRCPAEVAASQHAAPLAGEHERGTVGPGVGVEVLTQLGHERCWKSDGPDTGPRLRRGDYEGAVCFHVLAADADRAGLQVQIASRSAIDPPQRRLAKVASRISTRKRRAAMWSARPRTSVMVSTGRSGGFSSPPPRIQAPDLLCPPQSSGACRCRHLANSDPAGPERGLNPGRPLRRASRAAQNDRLGAGRRTLGRLARVRCRSVVGSPLPP